MERIVIKIDTAKTSMMRGEIYPTSRAVVRSSAIVGLSEDIMGNVFLTVKPTPESIPTRVIIENDFDEVADFMTK